MASANKVTCTGAVCVEVLKVVIPHKFIDLLFKLLIDYDRS